MVSFSDIKPRLFQLMVFFITCSVLTVIFTVLFSISAYEFLYDYKIISGYSIINLLLYYLK